MTGTVEAALRQASAALTEQGIEGAARDARLLMAQALGTSADRITLLARDPISASQRDIFDSYVARRLQREPVSHILGKRGFYGRDFIVTRDVLDPRPETETLVATALEVPFSTVLDLGTGSGAILLSLLAENPIAKGIGADVSDAALKIAQQNAAQLDLLARVKDWLVSDWFEKVEGRFDLIVSNPPYIALDEMPDLAPELSHEPRLALTDEADGLTAYRQICAGAMAHLNKGGRLLVEIGYEQGRDVAALFLHAGFKAVQVIPDLSGKDRVVSGVRRGA